MLRENSWKYKKKFKDFEITSYGALFFKEKRKKYLVVGDLHLGLEEALRLSGIAIPKKQILNIKKAISSLAKLYGYDITIIFNGDIKHEFGGLTYEEKKDIESLISYILERFEDLIAIKGNHDNFVIQLLKRKGIELIDYFETKKFHIEHGHKEMDLKNINKHIVISHEHPAITLRDDVGASMKIDCYLIHKDIHDRYIVVLPSFSAYSSGLDILRISNSDIDTNIIREIGLEKFEIYGINKYDNEILYFGKVKELKNIINEIIR